MAKFHWIVEDGSCVENSNTYATPECGREYWSNRIGGEEWNLSFEGENYCYDAIRKALIGAMDYIRTLELGPSYCKDSYAPVPIKCDCRGKSPVDILKEVQLIAANAILNGWNPFSVTRRNTRLVTSVSSPDEGSATFARPTPLQPFVPVKSEEIARQAKAHINKILKPILVNSNKGIRVLS